MRGMDKKTAYFTFAPTLTKDAQGIPTQFTGIAYSGGVVPDYGWLGDTVIDLDTLELPTGEIFALVDHDFGQRAGRITATRQGNEIHVSGHFFKSSEAGKEVAALFAEGAPWQMSLGLIGDCQHSDAPIEREINGAKLSANTLLTNSLLREVSFVPVGADPNTSVAAFSASGNTATQAPRPGRDHPNGDNTTMTIDELKAQVAELSAQLADASARATAAENALKAQAEAARKQEISTLAAKMEKTFTEAEINTFAAMPADAFSTVQTMLLASKPAAAQTLPAHLTQEQATNGSAGDVLTLSQLNAQLTAQLNKGV